MNKRYFQCFDALEYLCNLQSYILYEYTIIKELLKCNNDLSIMDWGKWDNGSEK